MEKRRKIGWIMGYRLCIHISLFLASAFAFALHLEGDGDFVRRSKGIHFVLLEHFLGIFGSAGLVSIAIAIIL